MTFVIYKECCVTVQVLEEYTLPENYGVTNYKNV
jgi:hypothetical protein